MQNLHGYLHGIKWIMFHGHLDYYQKPPLGGRSNIKMEDHGVLNAHNCWFILFYHVWGSTWIEIYWNNIWLRVRLHYDFTLHLSICDHVTWIWRCVGMAFGQCLLGSHNFMVTSRGLCVKWPLGVVVIVVYFLWFWFHGKGLTIVNHIHNHPLPCHPLFRVVIHIWGGCSCTCGITKELQDQGMKRRWRRQPF